jgi:hypothetical protein
MSTPTPEEVAAAQARMVRDVAAIAAMLDDLPPSLAAAHVPKNGSDHTADLKAFGSAFFHNYARMTWSVRKQADSDSDENRSTPARSS